MSRRKWSVVIAALFAFVVMAPFLGLWPLAPKPVVAAPPPIPTGTTLEFSGFVASMSDGTIIRVDQKSTPLSNEYGYAIVCYSSTDGGTTWSSPTTLASAPGTSSDFVQSPSGGITSTDRIVVFYSHSDATIYSIYSDGGCTGSWSSPATLNTGSATRLNPYGGMIAVDHGKLMQGWYSVEPNNIAFATFSTDNGATWSAGTTVLTDDTNNISETSFSYLANDTIVGVARNQDAVKMTQVMSTDNGASWTNQGLIAEDSTSAVNKLVSPWVTSFNASGTFYVVAYYADRESPYSIKALISDRATLVAHGASGWLNVVTVKSGLWSTGKFGYPSAFEPAGGGGFGMYFSAITATTAEIFFFDSPPFVTTISGLNFVADDNGNQPQHIIPVKVSANDGSGFQQMVTLDPAGNGQCSTYFATNLQNVNFQDGAGNLLYSWQETRLPTCSSTNVIYWVKLPDSSITTIYMVLVGTGQTSYGTHTGVEPTYDGTYGHYDNGASVFPWYENFIGTSLPADMTAKYGKSGAPEYTVNNGLVISPSATTYTTLLYKTSAISGASVVEAYTTAQTGSYAGGVNLGTVAPVNTGTGNVWVVVGTAYANYLSNGGPSVVLRKDVAGTPTTLDSASVTAGAHVITLQWPATGTESGLYDYDKLVSSSDNAITKTSTVYPEVWCYGNGAASSCSYQWLRTRTYPTGGAMPTTIGGIPLTLPVVTTVTTITTAKTVTTTGATTVTASTVSTTFTTYTTTEPLHPTTLTETVTATGTTTATGMAQTASTATLGTTTVTTTDPPSAYTTSGGTRYRSQTVWVITSVSQSLSTSQSIGVTTIIQKSATESILTFTGPGTTTITTTSFTTTSFTTTYPTTTTTTSTVPTTTSTTITATSTTTVYGVSILPKNMSLNFGQHAVLNSSLVNFPHAGSTIKWYSAAAAPSPYTCAQVIASGTQFSASANVTVTPTIPTWYCFTATDPDANTLPSQVLWVSINPVSTTQTTTTETTTQLATSTFTTTYLTTITGSNTTVTSTVTSTGTTTMTGTTQIVPTGSEDDMAVYLSVGVMAGMIVGAFLLVRRGRKHTP